MVYKNYFDIYLFESLKYRMNIFFNGSGAFTFGFLDSSAFKF